MGAALTQAQSWLAKRNKDFEQKSLYVYIGSRRLSRKS